VVVVVTPALEEYPRLLKRVEDLAFQQLVLQFAVQALDGAVLPRRAGLDAQRLHADLP